MKHILKFGVSLLVVAVLATTIGSTFANATPPPSLNVTSSGATNVTKTSATLNGSVAYLSGTPTISERGFDYGLSTDYESTVVADGDPVIGDFSASITGLACGTTYHVRAYSIPVIISQSKSHFFFALFATVAHASPGPQKSVGTDLTFSTPSCVEARAVRHTHSGTSAAGQVANLIAIGNPGLAEKIAKQYGVPMPGILATPSTLPAPSVATTSTLLFARDLHIGSVGDDVRTLQQYLNGKGFIIAATGPGSVGNESVYFGPATKAALIQFQKTIGIVPASGYFGILTRTYTQTH